MHKIAVMGDRDSIFGFASLGMHIFPVDDPAEAAPMLHKMAESGYAVIFITELLPQGSKTSSSATAQDLCPQ